MSSDYIDLPSGSSSSSGTDVNIHDSAGNDLTSTGTSLDVNVTNSVPVSGTVTADQGTSPWVTSFSAPQHVIADSGTIDTITNAVTVNQGTTPWVVSGSGSSPDVNIHDSAGGTLTSTGTSLDVNVTNSVSVSGTVTANQGTSPWIVDGSGSTQPISGTVTANAGTNLNTSALNLEATQSAFKSANHTDLLAINTTLGTPFQAGGSIANTSFIATQGTGTNLHTVVDSGTVSVTQGTSPWVTSFSAPQHTILDSGTLTGITNPIHTILDSGTLTTITNPVTVAQATAANLNATVTGTVALSSGSAVIGHVINDAGSAIIGSVGIDQTTPGTTNAVKATNFPTTVDTNAGASGASTLRTASNLYDGSANALTSTSNNSVVSLNQNQTGSTTYTGSGSLTNGASTIDITTYGATTLNISTSGTFNILWVALGSYDGSTYPTTATLIGYPSSTSSAVAGAIGNGPVTFNCAGYSKVRIKPFIYTSGTANIAYSLGFGAPWGVFAYNPKASNFYIASSGAITPGTAAGASDLIGGLYNTSPPTLTDGQQAALQCDSTGHLVLGGGSATIGALTANQSVNVAQINAVTPLMGNGVTGTGSQRVTIASDNTAFGVKLTDGTDTALVTTAGSVQVDQFSLNGNAISTGNGTAGTGTQRVTIASDNTAFSVNATPPTLTLGTQGTTGYSVQDLKDAGRTDIRYYATAAASGTTTTETAITLTKSSGTASTTTATSFVITNGKRFRIQNITFATRGNATATIQSTTFNFRINTAGAVTTSSTPIVLSVRSATPATASAWDRVFLEIPDGWEIVGDGTLQFGITAAATFTTNAPTWDVLIKGYEY